MKVEGVTAQPTCRRGTVSVIDGAGKEPAVGATWGLS